MTQQRGSACVPPAGSFSPDGSKFVSYLLDESAVPELNLLQHVPEDGSFRPRLWTFRYPLPGDPQPHAQLIVFDLRSQRAIAVDHPPMLAQVYGPIVAEQVTWSSDSRKLFIVDNRRGYHELTWTEADALSGITRPLIVEQGSGSVLAEARGQDAPTRVVLTSGDFIWTSERSGWRHLYYYDRNGRERRALTSGAWVVREILRVDEAARTIFFTAAGKEPGQDPYLRQVYQVRFDGTGLRRLTPELADHWVKIARTDARLVDPWLPGTGQGGFSVSGKFFVDSFAAPDRATVTVIRDRRGRSVLTLETARLAPDLAAHYVPPEPFSVLAADGTTVLWGSLFRPSDFDTTRSYPVIDSVYPGPQQTRVSKRFMNDSAQAVAELGFIVVALDARGTPLRSRAFREASYGNLAAAGSLDDHVAAIRTLARTRPYLDVTRVGVYGGSAGGFATVHALLDYPDFFKVGVAYTGNHDLRSYLTVWGERYQGDFDTQGYARAASYTNAAQLQGKLLLVHGDMDDNVPPANTLRVVDALIKSNKSFDLLILPNVNHAGVSQHPYFIRRLWDYFVTYLAQAVPPADYLIQGPVPRASQP